MIRECVAVCILDTHTHTRSRAMRIQADLDSVRFNWFSLLRLDTSGVKLRTFWSPESGVSDVSDHRRRRNGTAVSLATLQFETNAKQGELQNRFKIGVTCDSQVPKFTQREWLFNLALHLQHLRAPLEHLSILTTSNSVWFVVTPAHPRSN